MRTGSILSRKDPDRDPDDARRVDEIESNYQPKSHLKFTGTPDSKQVKEGELFMIDDGTTRSLGIKIANVLYKVDLTAI